MNKPTVASLLVLLALLACKKEEPKPEAVPPATAAAPAATPTPAPAPAPSAEPAADPAQAQAKTGMPTEGNSKPPSVSEWDGVGEITVRHSTPLACETKLVREWLRVSCRSTDKSKHQIKNVEVASGAAKGGIPPFVKKGVASIVTQVKKGMDVQYTFTWDTFARHLKVAWPNGAPSPTIEFDASLPD